MVMTASAGMFVLQETSFYEIKTFIKIFETCSKDVLLA